MGRRIRLSEQDLHRVIKESIKRIIREEKVWHNNSELVTAFNNLFDTINNVYHLSSEEHRYVSDSLSKWMEQICNDLNLRDDRMSNGSSY